MVGGTAAHPFGNSSCGSLQDTQQWLAGRRIAVSYSLTPHIPEGGSRMHPLYEKAIEVAEKLKEARLQVAHLSSEWAEAEYDLSVAQARAERGLIKKVGGEKKLGSTVESRERVFTLARDADEDYRAQLERRNQAKIRLEQAKVEAASLSDKLNIMLAAMRAEKSNE